jgi:hypothetical protein
MSETAAVAAGMKLTRDAKARNTNFGIFMAPPDEPSQGGKKPIMTLNFYQD